ncbi:SH3 domain-containing protein [Taklimakanibacter deserti]|uniref:SH3 domain-containing protein n=1 Tax=Taklimakanibacter deserti TaxID=2267839 RepID=UPI000E648CA6
MRIFLIAACLMLTAGAAHATSGPGCLIVTNVAANDVLNMRGGPGTSHPIVDVLPPGNHGIIHLDGPCVPKSAAPRSRWCKVSHYNGDKVTKGWIKRRFTVDSDCP